MAVGPYREPGIAAPDPEWIQVVLPRVRSRRPDPVGVRADCDSENAAGRLIEEWKALSPFVVVALLPLVVAPVFAAAMLLR